MKGGGGGSEEKRLPWEKLVDQHARLVTPCTALNAFTRSTIAQGTIVNPSGELELKGRGRGRGRVQKDVGCYVL
jgi:hypothetical protein